MITTAKYCMLQCRKKNCKILKVAGNTFDKIYKILYFCSKTHYTGVK